MHLLIYMHTAIDPESCSPVDLHLGTVRSNVAIARITLKIWDCHRLLIATGPSVLHLDVS